MLPVSDLLEVARGEASSEAVGARARQRFARPGAQAPVVIWNVCMHCNMGCPHCYAAAVSRPSPTDLTTAEGLRLLAELAACGVSVVIFSGGEPLLRPDLFELLARARDLGIAPQLSTNGVFIDDAVAERLACAGVAYVGVSIDGLRAFNDDYRRLEGGYEAALRGLRAAKAAGMRTGLRMTLTSRNADQLDALIDVAEDVAADRFYASHLVYAGRGLKIADEDLSRAQARAALHHLFERAEARLARGRGPRIVTGSNDSNGVLLLRWIEARYGPTAARPVEALLLARGGNSAGEKVLNIDHRGRVHPDQFWRRAVLGDVRTQSFESILAHPLRARLANRLDHLEGRCGACASRALCRGSHRERAIARYGELWAPDPSCVMEDAEIGLASAAAPLREARGA
ncbi:MAG: radical SAM protein [Deltaproteobacteria bacterium]|nr:MAG: radical SAM protein [Deltaproteobacteria bacterium]